MKPDKISSAYRLLHGVILVFIFGLSIYLTITVLLYIITIVDPIKTSDLVQTNSLFHLAPKGEMPDIVIQSDNRKFDVQINSIMVYLNFKTSSRLYHVLTFIPHMARLALYLLIFITLRGFLITLKGGDPFIHENAVRIRTVGIFIIICELLRVIKDFSAVFYLKGVLSSPSFEVSTLPFEFYLEYLRPDLIFIGLVVLVFSEIFRLGASMREEQRLTI